MRIKNLLLLLIVLFILVPIVHGYEVSLSGQGEGAQIKEVHGIHLIKENGDLESKFWIILSLPPNYHNKYENVYFTPWNEDRDEINVSLALCDMTIYQPKWTYPFDSSNSWGYSDVCTKFSYINSTTNSMWPYSITFFPYLQTKEQDFIFLINYTTLNFTTKQGDYNVAWLKMMNMKNNAIIDDHIILPSEEDIPRFIPETKEIKRLKYNANGKELYRWAFIIEGNNDKIIWYYNDKEVKAKEEAIQWKYTKKGFWLGLLGSIFVGAVLVILERFFFDWTKYGNKLLIWLQIKLRFKKVIGNQNNRIYHHLDCVFVDNIKNRMVFKSREDAIREGYEPCNICTRHL